MLPFLLWDDLLGLCCSHFQLLSQCRFVFNKWKQALLAEFRWLARPFLWLEKLSVTRGSIMTLSPPYSHYMFWLLSNVMDYYSEFINHIAFTIMLLTLQKLFNYLQSVQWNAENTSIQFFYKHISVQSLVFFGFCHFCSCDINCLPWMTSPVFYERLFYFNFCCVLCACWYFLRLWCISLRDAVRMGGLKEKKQHQARLFSSFVVSIISSFQFVHREEESGGHLQILRIKMHNIFIFNA